MTLSVDAPPEDAGGHSLEIPWLGGGMSDGGHLFEELSPGADQVLYVRYYVKFPPAGRYRRAGVWMGGLNPPLPAPDLQDGIRPNGQDRFAAAAERDSATAQIGSVDYWTGMRPSADGQYAANLLRANPTAQASAGRWTCVEQTVRLNDPAASNGEHAIWLDGAKVSDAGPGFPNGTWSGNTFRAMRAARRSKVIAGGPFRRSGSTGSGCWRTRRATPRDQTGASGSPTWSRQPATSAAWRPADRLPRISRGGRESRRSRPRTPRR